MTMHGEHPFTGPVKAVVFDWAGTIIDFGSLAPVAAVIEAFRRQGVSVSTEAARGPMGRAKRDHLSALFEVPEVRKDWERVHGRPPSESDLDALYAEFLPLQHEILAGHCELIPGAIEVVADCRARGMRVGTSTGYTRELMGPLLKAARRQGFEPDAVVTASDVSPGRPSPWMCLENARLLGVFPPSAIVNVDDTEAGVLAGVNAGMWSIGVTKSGNLIGLSEAAVAALPADELNRRVEAASRKLFGAGAHYVVETVAELPPVVDQINARLQAGERP